jgi:peptidoglycan hydrolase-like protein with peptidoglycan-binding domain
MKVRPIAIAVMTLSSAATFAFANTSDKTPQASNPGYSTGTLSSQADNATITQLQQALNDKGYNVGTVDGQLGPKTKSALKKFQQAQGLSQSGQVDSQTVAALNLGAGSPNASIELNSSQAQTTSQGANATNGSTTSQSANGMAPSPQPQSQQPQSQQQSPGSTPTSSTPTT